MCRPTFCIPKNESLVLRDRANQRRLPPRIRPVPLLQPIPFESLLLPPMETLTLGLSFLLSRARVRVPLDIDLDALQDRFWSGVRYGRSLWERFQVDWVKRVWACSRQRAEGTTSVSDVQDRTSVDECSVDRLKSETWLRDSRFRFLQLNMSICALGKREILRSPHQTTLAPFDLSNPCHPDHHCDALVVRF